jgi:hypothetical protein
MVKRNPFLTKKEAAMGISSTRIRVQHARGKARQFNRRNNRYFRFDRSYRYPLLAERICVEKKKLDASLPRFSFSQRCL